MLNQAKIEGALTKSGVPSSDFDLNPALLPKLQTELKQAGVLVPLIKRPQGVQVILTKRSLTISQHAGQVAFPGGKVDPTDKDHIAAAIREADEEIGLPPSLVEVLGELPPHRTVSNFLMKPVVGWVAADFTHKIQEREVSEVFEVPLQHVINTSNFQKQSRKWQGHSRFFYTVPYGPYYIWGATARVLYSLAERMDLEKTDATQV